MDKEFKASRSPSEYRVWDNLYNNYISEIINNHMYKQDDTLYSVEDFRFPFGCTFAYWPIPEEFQSRIHREAFIGQMSASGIKLFEGDIITCGRLEDDVWVAYNALVMWDISISSFMYYMPLIDDDQFPDVEGVTLIGNINKNKELLYEKPKIKPM